VSSPFQRVHADLDLRAFATGGAHLQALPWHLTGADIDVEFRETFMSVPIERFGF
jgi:hypothetical protein